MLEAFIVGISVALVTGIWTNYSKIARLRVNATAGVTFFFGFDNNYGGFNVSVTNVGRENTEIKETFLELKKGADSIKIKDAEWNTSIKLVPTKRTTNYSITCARAAREQGLSNYTLIRLKVITTNDRVFKSKWIEVQSVIDAWSKCR